MYCTTCFYDYTFYIILSVMYSNNVVNCFFTSCVIFHRHYVVQGPDDSPYAGGFYHGRLVFPTEYPFRPPTIYMITPSGRFKTNIRLCLSISDFHPDTWNPAWSVSTILTGLLSFMVSSFPGLHLNFSVMS